MAFNAFVVITCTTFFIYVTKRFKPLFNVGLSGFLYALGFGMLFYVRDFTFILLSTFVWTVGEILSVTNGEVYVANHTPMSHRGRFNSIIPIVTGMGFSLSPLFTGQFIEAHSVFAVWMLSFFLAFLGSSGFFLLYAVETGIKKRKRIGAGGEG